MRRYGVILGLVLIALVALAVGSFAPAASPPVTLIDQVYDLLDGSSLTMSGQVCSLERGAAWANFVLRDSTSQIHVYWPYNGADSSWLDDGTCAVVTGVYQVANPHHAWEPQVQASAVVLAPSGCLSQVTSHWTLESFGGASEVAGSCHLVRTATHGFLVDCGSYMNTDDMPATYQSSHSDDESLPVGLGGVSAIVVTHAHADHVGRLHYLVYQGYEGPIYMTEATAALFLNQLPTTLEYSTIPEPERNLVEGRLRAMIRTHPYLEPFQICEGATAVFINAGHIPGSASVVISLSTGPATSSVVVFSGDLGSGHHPFLEGPDLATLGRIAATTLIVESTYGGEPRREYPVVEEDLYKPFWQILRSAKAENKLVLIPTFSLDRTQRVLSAILEGERTRDQEGVPYLPELSVAVGGKSSCELTHVYQDLLSDSMLCQRYFARGLCEDAPLLSSGWHYLRDDCCCGDEYKGVTYRSYDVIVTPSGTGSRSDSSTTLSHELIKQFVDDPDVIIVKVGWAPEWTPMGQLHEDSMGVISVDGEQLQVKAQIRPQQDVFSGHADAALLTRYVRSLPELSKVIIVHGDDSRGERQGLRDALLVSDGWQASTQVVLPLEGQEIPLN
jgi:metallo-beta-lactamase family protein